MHRPMRAKVNDESRRSFRQNQRLRTLVQRLKQEAQLSPRDRAMRRVN